jgi:hypothetical protein
VHSFSLCLRQDEGYDLVEDDPDVDRLGRNVQTTGFDLRKVENVVDEREKLLACR